jgi:hypothetical protein
MMESETIFGIHDFSSILTMLIVRKIFIISGPKREDATGG